MTDALDELATLLIALKEDSKLREKLEKILVLPAGQRMIEIETILHDRKSKKFRTALRLLERDDVAARALQYIC